MHKKKNSASVLAGEMILTFYKPKRASKPARVAAGGVADDPAGTLSAVFDACLANGATAFTSEALFNRLVMELWRRRALGCLSWDRRVFAQELAQRGWSYDTTTHLWKSSREPASSRADLVLFGA